MEIKVTYYRLGPNGMPISPEQHEIVEVAENSTVDQGELIKEALHKKTFISEDHFKIINTLEM